MAFDARGLPKAETLHELFDRHGIELHEMPIPGRQHGGHRTKIYCPQCGGGREKERNFFVAIDPDGQGAAWHCFRANSCGFSGGDRLKNAPERRQAPPRQYRRPTPDPVQATPDELLTYFEEFGISAVTVHALGIYRTIRSMPWIDKEGVQDRDRWDRRPVIAYPYVDDGELVNVKYKTIYRRGEKTLKRFTQEKDTRRSLFNIDSFVNPEWGIFVEGEDDVAAIYEAGWRQVTTLPDGSPTKLSEHYDRATDDDQRYVALYGEPRIDRLEKIYLAGDMDEAGVRHMEEIARRLGKGRCWLVRWPQDCKDAKDTLQKRGPEAVSHAIESAMPYPLEGVHYVTDEALCNLHAGIAERRLVTGHQAIDEYMALSDEGQLITCTGHSGRGKTTFWNGVAVLYTERNEQEMGEDRLIRPFHTLITSAEMKPDVMASRLIAQRAHMPFRSTQQMEQMSREAMLEEYAPWVRRHFTFIRWPDRATQPTLTWLMERGRENIIRTGAKLWVIDPWQEFDDEMPDRFPNHSRWVGKRIQQFVGMAFELRVNIVLVVHTHMMKREKDGKLPIPEGHDIADSKHFDSRCDIGLTVHRANMNLDEMMFKVWKAREPRFSHYGESTLRVDRNTFRLWPRLVDTGNSRFAS